MPQGGRYIECDRCRKSHFSLNLPWSRDSETLGAARAAGWKTDHDVRTGMGEDVCPTCLTLEDARPKGEPIAPTTKIYWHVGITADREGVLTHYKSDGKGGLIKESD
jgi:hypothetical protein